MHKPTTTIMTTMTMTIMATIMTTAIRTRRARITTRGRQAPTRSWRRPCAPC